MKSPLTAVARLHPLQGLALTFSRDDESGLRGLHILEHYDGLVTEGREWGVGLKECTVVVRRLWAVRDTLALERLLQDVEKIAVSGEHGAMGLQSSREKKREEALAALSQAVLTRCFLSSIDEEYGVAVTVTLDQPTIDEAWMARFDVKEGNETIATIYLDSFSGRWGQVKYGTWVWSNELYINPQQLRDAIMTALEAYLAT